MTQLSNPVVVQASVLPVPRIQGNPFPPSGAVAVVADAELAEPLTVLEQLIAEAVAPVEELQACRPGSGGNVAGAKWKDAVASDVEDVDGGERPRKYRAEVLMAGEGHRWSLAAALAGAVDVMLRRTTATLDTDRIASTAKTVEAAKARVWAAAARAGWLARTDRAGAWGHVRVGESALEEYLAARRVREWASGEGWGARPDLHAQVPYVDHLPTDPTSRGFWLALRLSLNPDEVWLRIPNDVTFPEGSEALIDRAFPELGERFVALLEHGVYSVRK